MKHLETAHLIILLCLMTPGCASKESAKQESVCEREWAGEVNVLNQRYPRIVRAVTKCTKLPYLDGGPASEATDKEGLRIYGESWVRRAPVYLYEIHIVNDGEGKITLNLESQKEKMLPVSETLGSSLMQIPECHQLTIRFLSPKNPEIFKTSLKFEDALNDTDKNKGEKKEIDLVVPERPSLSVFGGWIFVPLEKYVVQTEFCKNYFE